MNKKVVFLDIDGTLVNMKGEISESTKEAIALAKNNGHQIVICSGRSYYQLYPELLALGFDGIVGGAGAYVICDKKEIFHNYMPAKPKKKLFHYLEQNKFIYAIQCDIGTVMNERCAKEMRAEWHKAGFEENTIKYLLGKLMIQEDVENYKNEEKVIYHQSPFPIEKVKEDVAPYFEVTGLSLEEVKKDAGEIGVAGINKSTGMQLYLEHNGFSREDTVAIGDGPNDFEMLDFADISVAMGNAIPALKAKADFVTTSIEQDGIYNAFKKIGLI